ncbi:disaggregatase related repeat protein [Sporocytophaga myxococcoides]|uniref:Disaggregatase related repeat protein n=1 Tax=Sporocytophaga myxococcoides TaxID=153721 RepID=A0A098LKT2_9BACT|nr:DNRLRE domain-containing protein [Sporocytophaga myxococcoides]GAL86967.1 disaggregatase related repeat protein [Sporocytophaga myxococcoides]
MSKIFPFALVTITLLFGCAKIACDPAPTPPAFIQSADLMEDAMVISYYPDLNLGYTPKLYIQAWTYNQANVRVTGFLKFDYSSLRNAKVSKAKLTLFADTTSFWDGSPAPQYGHYVSNKSIKIQIKRVNESWSESTIAHGNKPTSVNANMVSSLAPASNSQSYTFDVTEIVKDQINLGNNGFEISLSSYAPYERYAFYSREGIHPQLRPKIEFEYKK